MKLAFIMEIVFENGNTERVGVVHETWHEATIRAHTYIEIKYGKDVKYHINHGECGRLI